MKFHGSRRRINAPEVRSGLSIGSPLRASDGNSMSSGCRGISFRGSRRRQGVFARRRRRPSAFTRPSPDAVIRPAAILRALAPCALALRRFVAAGAGTLNALRHRTEDSPIMAIGYGFGSLAQHTIAGLRDSLDQGAWGTIKTAASKTRARPQRTCSTRRASSRGSSSSGGDPRGPRPRIPPRPSADPRRDRSRVRGRHLAVAPEYRGGLS